MTNGKRTTRLTAITAKDPQVVDQIARLPGPVKKPKRTFKRKTLEAPGGYDAIEALINDIGAIQSPFAAYRAQQKREGKTPFQKTSLGGEWDGWRDLPAGLKALIFRPRRARCAIESRLPVQ